MLQHSVLQDCSWRGNSAVAVAESAAGVGGALYIDGATADISSSTVTHNTATASSPFSQLSSYGGGIAMRGKLSTHYCTLDVVNYY
jgi:hypothetical protein